MSQSLLRIGAILGFFGVAFGAFGTHALRDRLTPDLLQVWQTAVQYQMIHAVAACLCGVLLQSDSRNSKIQTSGWLFVGGIAIFSGSLYVLALTGIRVLGAITPLGGLCFLAGWLLFALFAGNSRSSAKS